jgi:hypothetical protein
MAHDPTTCPFCGDLNANGNTGYFPEQFQVHVLAKLAELEGRLQQTEWRDMPLGPGPDGNYGQGDLEKERIKRVAELLGRKEPECAACYDEEGSWACIRPAHGKMKTRDGGNGDF